MKNKILLLFSLLVLSSLAAHAQTKMSKAEFEHLVDYANCQYLMAFMEKNYAGKPYIEESYQKTVKPTLQAASPGQLNDIPTIETIRGLFDDKANGDALQLAETINRKKSKYDKRSDNKSLIELLSAKTWKKRDLTETAAKIISDVNTHLNTVSTKITNPDSNSTTEDSVIISHSLQLRELKNQYDALNNDLITLTRWAIGCLVLICLLMVACAWWYKRQFNTANQSSSVRRFVNYVFFNSEEIQNKLDNTNPKTTGKNVSGEYDIVSGLKNRIKKLEDDLTALNTKMTQKKEEQYAPNQRSQQLQETSASNDDEIFFVSKINKQFTDETTGATNASFRVFAITGSEAKFDYIGPVRNENWFEGVCTIENSLNDNLSDRKNISMIQSGKLKKENNTWIVATPAKIKFV